jgi:hypothetical protein
MQFGLGKPSAGVVFDADLGNTIDDALALALLYGLQGKSESRVISVTVTKPSLQAAEFADTLVRFYTGDPGPFGGVQPIGLALTGKMPEDTPMMTAVLGKTAPDGKPAYARSIAKLNDTADPVATLRNALSAQYDQNAMVVLAGPATNLAALLDLPEAKALITAKVKHLCVSIGAYPDGAVDPAVQADLPAARKLFSQWPGPILAAGSELGLALPFPAASLDKDFAWSPSHPLVDAYKAARPMPYDAPSGALAAALQAVRPQENYFKLSDPGSIQVGDDGRTKFVPAAGGKHRYLVLDPAQKDKVLQAYTELASTKPVPRPVRFRPQQKKQ